MNTIRLAGTFRNTFTTMTAAEVAKAPDSAIVAASCKVYIDGVLTAQLPTIAVGVDHTGQHLVTITPTSLAVGQTMRVWIPYDVDAINYIEQFVVLCVNDTSSANILAAMNATPPNVNVATVYYVSASAANDLANGLTTSTPKQTITAAKDLASAGDLVVVGYGTYDERDLWKNDIQYHFETGAHVRYTGSAGAVFNNPVSNASRLTITGDGILEHAGTGADRDVFQVRSESVLTVEAKEMNSTGRGLALILGMAVMNLDRAVTTDGTFDVLGAANTRAYVKCKHAISNGFVLEMDGGYLHAEIDTIESTSQNAIEAVDGKIVCVGALIKSFAGDPSVVINDGMVVLDSCAFEANTHTFDIENGGNLFLINTNVKAGRIFQSASARTTDLGIPVLAAMNATPPNVNVATVLNVVPTVIVEPLDANVIEVLGVTPTLITEPISASITGLDAASLLLIGQSIRTTANSPSSVDGTSLEIVRNDSYDGVANPLLSWTVAKDYTTFTGVMTIRNRKTNAAMMTKAVVIASETLITASLSSADTAFASLLIRSDFGPHPYDIEFTKDDSKETQPMGVVVIKRDSTVA